jgi:hypothetical protein
MSTGMSVEEISPIANSGFNASLFVSESLNRQLLNTSQELAVRCIRECGLKYGFNAEEAILEMGIVNIRVERPAPKARATTAGKARPRSGTKVKEMSPLFPLPYSGELDETLCFALRQNHGLYTQCRTPRNGEKELCKGCVTKMTKAGLDKPQYGTIQERRAVGIMEYVDAGGKGPTPYAKVMKKFKVTTTQALEEAAKFGWIIDEVHFAEGKEGKNKRSRNEKGRPKKAEMVIEIDNGFGDDEDVFSALVAKANEEPLPKKVKKSNEKDEAAKVSRKAKRKAEETTPNMDTLPAKGPEEPIVTPPAAKGPEEPIVTPPAARGPEEPSVTPSPAKGPEEPMVAPSPAKGPEEPIVTPPAVTSVKPVKKAEPEGDVVKKFVFEGTTYLRSKKTGIIYDYYAYLKTKEQMVIGKWDETLMKIVFERSETDSSDSDLDSDEELNNDNYD